jgi:hypothetical protein
MSEYHDEDEADLREDEDPDESDMDDDDAAEDETDWADEPPRSRPIWITIGLILIVAALVWVFLIRRWA